jgi:general secretion pathway protein K
MMQQYKEIKVLFPLPLRERVRVRGVFNNEKGIALIITLLVVTLLTALIVEFAYSARVNLSAAGNFRDKQKAYYLAKSGVNFIEGMLKDNKKNKKADDLNQMIPPVTVGDGIVSLKAFDESAKINIKNVKETNKTERGRLERLFEIKGIDAYLLAGIFERESYGLVSELRLARGMTDEIYDKIKDYLTVYPVDDKININTADATVLRCLSPFITEDMAQRIISYREKNRFTNDNIKDLENVVGTTIYNEIKNYIGYESNYYSAISTGMVNDVENRIEAVLERRSATEVKRRYWRNQ